MSVEKVQEVADFITEKEIKLVERYDEVLTKIEWFLKNAKGPSYLKLSILRNMLNNEMNGDTLEVMGEHWGHFYL